MAARTYVLRNRGAVRGPRLRHLRDPDLPGVPRPLHREPAVRPRGGGDPRAPSPTYRGVAHQRALHLDLRRPHRDRREHLRGRGRRPYLVGVTCAPEREAWATVRTTARPQSLGDEPGLNRDVALLVALGVARPAAVRDGRPRGARHRGGAARLDGAPRRRARPQVLRGRPRDGLAPAAAPSSRHLVGRCAGTIARQRLLAPDDEDYLLQHRGPRASWRTRPRRRAAALLLQEGVVTPFPDNTLRPDAPITRVAGHRRCSRAAALVAGAAGAGLRRLPPGRRRRA